jgi:xylan 1,4-beta-xylosidase
MLRADLQEHLRNVQRDIGFARIRGHGILNDDMSVWLGGSVNMYNVFRVLDVLLALTPPMHPILELSFMPDDLAYDKSHTIMHYKGGTSAPRDFAQWERFIGDFVQLIVDRYGIATVQQFRFEAWNEPAYCGFYCPPPNVTNLDSYLALYNATSRAVLGVDATLSVGGPATAELGWVDEFIASGLPARFLSSHSYPTDARGSPYTRTSFEEALYEVANKSAAAGLPFVMTEASAGWEGNAYDAPFAGAWIVHMAAAFLGVANVPTISYWTLSDVRAARGIPARAKQHPRPASPCTLPLPLCPHSLPALHADLRGAGHGVHALCRGLWHSDKVRHCQARVQGAAAAAAAAAHGPGRARGQRQRARAPAPPRARRPRRCRHGHLPHRGPHCRH